MAEVDDVRAVANAYREALAEGDRVLAYAPVERKILLAIVAASAADTAAWVKTRVPDGDRVVEPLDALVPVLQKANLVGHGMELAKRALVSQAKSAVSALVLGQAAPILVLAVVAGAAGWLGFSYDAGVSVGGLLIPAVLGGGAALGGIVQAVRAGSRLGPGLGQAAGNLYDSAGLIGSAAEGVVLSAVRQPLTQLRGEGALADGATPVVRELRSAAQLVVVGAFVALGIGVVYFGFGLVDAWEAYSATLCSSDNPSACYSPG